MKDEYIEVDKIIDFIDEHIKCLGDGEAYRRIEYYLEFADRLEIIRCKDCEYFIETTEAAYGYCRFEELLCCRNSNDFCSYAERREDEEDS